jgi:putative spermidine/putrescine transport system substrate-binding protein
MVASRRPKGAKMLTRWCSAIVLAILLVIGGLVALVPSTAPAAGSLTVQMFGGSFEETTRKFIIEPFAHEHGAEVNVVLGAAPLARLRAEGSRPSVDYLHLGEEEAYIAESNGQLAALDFNNIPNARDLYKEAMISDRRIATHWGSWGLVYRTDRVAQRPTSWLDLWNPALRGKVMIWDGTFETTTDLLSIVAESQGVSDFPSEKAMAGVEKKLADLKPNIFGFAKSQTEIQAALNRGDVWMAITANGRAAQWKKEGSPVEFVIPREGGMALTTVVGITANSPNKMLAEQFLNQALSDTAQAAFAERNLFAPTIKHIKVAPELIPQMPYGPEQVQRLRHIDFARITPWRDRLVEMFNRALK